MKICTIIAEYNPFHNGHLRQIKYVKENISPDFIIVIMSGTFTQRGEVACLDKYTRASHCIKGGADLVLELPQVFSSQNAEVFAKGALSILSKIKGEKILCFGTETASLETLIEISKISLNESEDYKKVLKENLAKGLSYIVARKNALTKVYSNQNIDFSIMDTPNNILAIEYIKAIIQNGYDFTLNAITRNDKGYLDSQVGEEFSSALSIREALLSGKKSLIKGVVPAYTYKDLPKKLTISDSEILYSLLTTTSKKLKKVPDCTEGLENRILLAVKECTSLEELIEKVKTKRYSTARLKRIFINNLLGIDTSLVKKALSSSLYFRVLAIKKGSEKVLNVLADSNTLPIIERKSSIKKLKGISKKCFEKDLLALNVYSLMTKKVYGEYIMKII